MNGFFYIYRMTNTSFLDKIAKVLIDDYSGKLSNTIVVLPNKRAKIFLIEALKKQVEIEKACALGIVSVLRKPYTQPMLLREIARALV